MNRKVTAMEELVKPDIDDGKPFKSYYTSRDSRVNIEFPWTQPDRPEYVFDPTEEFPSEVLE